MSEQKVEDGFCFAKEVYKVTPFQLRTFWTHTLNGRWPSYKFGRNRLFKKSEILAAIEKSRVDTSSDVLP